VIFPVIIPKILMALRIDKRKIRNLTMAIATITD
jgi:hypothetical protein